MDSNKKKNSVRYKCQVRDINKKACLTRLQPDICFVTKVARGGRCSRSSLFNATFAPTLLPLRFGKDTNAGSTGGGTSACRPAHSAVQHAN